MPAPNATGTQGRSRPAPASARAQARKVSASGAQRPAPDGANPPACAAPRGGQSPAIAPAVLPVRCGGASRTAMGTHSYSCTLAYQLLLRANQSCAPALHQAIAAPLCIAARTNHGAAVKHHLTIIKQVEIAEARSSPCLLVPGGQECLARRLRPFRGKVPEHFWSRWRAVRSRFQAPLARPTSRFGSQPRPPRVAPAPASGPRRSLFEEFL